MAIISNVMVKWLGGGISEQVIPVSSPVSRNSGVVSFQKKFPIILIKLAVPLIKGAVARYCACTAMIDSGSWLTNSSHFLPRTQNEVPFLNKSEARKRSRDREENGKCTNATNCRSRVGLSTSSCYNIYRSGEVVGPGLLYSKYNSGKSL